MDTVIFVQNIKKFCELAGVKPTVACRESGVGSSFINNIEKQGTIPSVEKVQTLAVYLGVTTSELLGEKKEPGAIPGPQPDILEKFNALSPDDKDEVRAIIEWKLAKKNKAP